MNSKKYLFIGCGNMGEPVLNAFLQSGVDPQKLTVIEKTEERQQYLQKQYGVTVKNDVLGLETDVVILAIKPQQLDGISFSSITFSQDALILSILAGTSIQKLQKATGISRIVRCMPNLPLMASKGMTSMVSENISSEEEKFFHKVFSQGGKVISLQNEDQMHAATLLAGSMPGFYYYFCSMFKNIAKDYGFSEAEARILAEQSFIGSAAFLESQNDSSEELVKKVASKGGTTEATLKSFEEQHLSEVFRRGIEDGVKRSRELGKITN